MTAPREAVERASVACERARLALATRWAGEPLAPSLLHPAAAHLEECEACRRIGDGLAEARWADEVPRQRPRIVA